MNFRTSRSSTFCAISILLGSSLILGAPSLGFCQPPPSTQRTQFLSTLPDRIEQGMKAEGIPGLAIAIVEKDAIVWSRGFGVTDVSAPQPVTDATLFSIQSISKTYTTVGFLRATQRWGVELDDKLLAYYPEFRINTRDGSDELRKITFRHLLSHWAGFPHEAPLGGNYDERYSNFDDHIASLAGSWMKAPVGARYSYSNVGVDLVGYVLTRLAKLPFDEYMKTTVLAPLGMHHSTFTYDEARSASSFARGHIEGTPVPLMRIPMQASGGMYSTATDLARFIIIALNADMKDSPLTAGQIRDMAEIQYALPGQRAGYGLGMEVGELSGSTLLQHGGGGYGYSTMQAWLPEYKLGVVVLTNAGDIGFNNTLARETLTKLVEIRRPRVPPTVKQRDPSFSHSAASLKKFEGNYKTSGRVVSIAVEGDRLVLQRGTNKTALTSIGRNMFAGETGDTLTFTLDKQGAVTSVLALDNRGVDTWFLNDKKGEPQGTFQPEWRDYVGAYRIGAYGNEFTTTITERNGYLFSSRNEGTKLIPFSDGLFFTPDGESVVFRGDKMTFGNRPALKITTTPPAVACRNYPAAEWTAWPTPETIGWSSAKLDAAKEYAEGIGSAAGMIISDGKVLLHWGATAQKFNVHSIRKSLLSALYGISVGKAEITLASTLASLGIDDNPPSLSAAEKQATVHDLLQATSGVFHPALYETADMIASKPARGMHPHGTYWLYSNWDFNVLGTIYERATYSTIFKEFKHRIAAPLQMQDYKPSDGEYVDGPESIHPAYPFRMTARDMARFGLLYLREGAWCGRQIIPAQWIKESTTAHHVTTYKPGVGYGYLWWVGVNGAAFPGFNIGQHAYYAWGTGGHYIVVVPELKLVIVNRVNTDVPGKRIDDEQFGKLVQLILHARD